MSAFIEAKELRKTYRVGKVDVPALRGISFSVQKGEFVTVVGPSGSGKSTLFYMLGGLTRADSGSVVIDGALIQVNHVVTNMVTQTSGGSNLPQVQVRPISLIDTSYNLKAVTNLTGPEINWCLPYNNQTGTGVGQCYDGNIYTNPIGTIGDAASLPGLPANGNFTAWNESGTDGDAAYVNTLNGSSGTTKAFTFWINNGGTFSDLLNVLRNGQLNVNGEVVASGYNIGATAGYTGTKTAGSCTLTIQGGLITNVTGC